MPTTQYIYLGHQYLCEADESGTLTKRCVNEPGTYTNLVSRKDLTTGETSYPLYDALGSTRVVTDETGDVTDTFVYDAWGNVLDRTGTTELPFQYVGRHGYYHDEETGLSYVMARIYDPRIIRWLSVDPLFISYAANHYQFALVSPFGWVDSSGLHQIVVAVLQDAPPRRGWPELPKLRPRLPRLPRLPVLPAPKEPAPRDCDKICVVAQSAPEIPKMGFGGLICDNGASCACLFPGDLPNGSTYTPGHCRYADALIIAHERKHITDVDPCDPCLGLYRPPFRDDLTPRQQLDRECELRLIDIRRMYDFFTDPNKKEWNSQSEECKKVMMGMFKLQVDWIVSPGNCNNLTDEQKKNLEATANIYV